MTKKNFMNLSHGAHTARRNKKKHHDVSHNVLSVPVHSATSNYVPLQFRKKCTDIPGIKCSDTNHPQDRHTPPDVPDVSTDTTFSHVELSTDSHAVST